MVARLWNLPGLGLTSQLNELDRMRRFMDQFASRAGAGPFQTPASAGVFPLINLTETKETYIIRAELPGVTADNLDIQTSGRNISITGERRISLDSSARYHRRERESGRFSRAVTLPGEIDRDHIEASLKHGILQIIIPKSEKAKPRQIQIK